MPPMAQHNVRRIAVEPQPDSNDNWDAGWLTPAARRVREWLFAASPWLTRWAGYAGIVGAVAWGAMFLYLLFLDYAFWFDWPILYTNTLPYLWTQALVVPILMFLLALFGLFLKQEVEGRRSAGLRRLGFGVAGIGLITMSLFTLNEYWLARLLRQPAGGLIHSPYAGELFDWVRETSSGITLATIGMALFGIAAARTRALPVWLAIWFVVAPLPFFVVPMGLSWFVSGYDYYGYDYYVILYGTGVFTGLMLLFGAVWAAAGYHLLRSRTRAQPPGQKPARRRDPSS
jgi:hypothetical protein